MKTRWECRYSSSEMMYLEIGDGPFVRMYLDHSPQAATHTAFAEVLAGAIDGEVSNLFGRDAVEQLKAAVRQQMTDPPQPYDKQPEMLRRRREG